MTNVIHRKLGRVRRLPDVDHAMIAQQIIDPVGHGPPTGRAGKVMHQHRFRLARPGLARIFEITDQFLLLGIHADHRLHGLQMDGALDFTTLKKRLETADGSLNLHLRRLEENDYITSHKAFVGLRPKTTYRMTPTGRKALTGYLKAMRELLDAIGSG